MPWLSGTSGRHCSCVRVGLPSWGGWGVGAQGLCIYFCPTARGSLRGLWQLDTPPINRMQAPRVSLQVPLDCHVIIEAKYQVGGQNHQEEYQSHGTTTFRALSLKGTFWFSLNWSGHPFLLLVSKDMSCSNQSPLCLELC